jgi:hypothetical protein
METLLKLIQGNIKRKLPATFGIIFDGWTCEGEHYIGIFATWTRDDRSVVKRLVYVVYKTCRKEKKLLKKQ